MISEAAQRLAQLPAPSSSRARGLGNDSAVISGFQGADLYNENRGYVYFPTLDTRRELDSWSRYELTRRSRFLYTNIGLAKRLIKGMSAMVVGRGIRPRPKTEDADWNAAALALFNNQAGSAAVFDVGGRFNFYQAQRMFMLGKLRDGNMFSLLAKTNAGLPAIRMVESHQVGNGSNDSTAPGKLQWIDGVLVNQNNRRLAYRLLDDEDNSTPVDAADMIAFSAIEDSPGRVMGPPVLAHAINHMLDMAEITGFLKLGIKQSSLVGYNLTGATRKAGLGGNVQKIATGPGPRDQIKVEEMFRGGKAVETEPGAEMKVLADPRPHPNAMGFYDYLIRDAAVGAEMQPEVLWDVTKLGGANTRFILAGAQAYAEKEQDELIEVFCKRYWVYFCAVNMANGLLPACDDPAWWTCEWMRPQKLTVDRGKDGKLYIELQGRGMLSLDRWYAEQGQDWEIETEQFIREKAWIKEKAEEYGLSLDDIFATVSAQGIAAPPPTAEDVPVEDDPVNPNEDNPEADPDPSDEDPDDAPEDKDDK